MLRNKLTKWIPNRLLWRLTLINILVVGAFIVISSWAIYDTACFLVDGFGSTPGPQQRQFDTTLFQYLLGFSITAIVVGSLIHFYLVKKLMKPLKVLTASTKTMKEGHYPPPMQTNSQDEVGQLITQFNALVSQLKASEQHRKEMVGDLSHEIRTPLSNINGYLNALKHGMVEGNEQVYDALLAESKRLTTMIEQLEQWNEWDDLSRQTYSEKAPKDMQLLIEQTLEMYRWSLTEANMTLHKEAEKGIVSAYHGGIEQVMSNLLDNAIRYYEGNGPIVVKGENLATHYRFTITAPGQPIPNEAQDKIFERLYRVDPSRTREQAGGNGLGLAISKEIIEHHQGAIGLFSTGNEHTFWFTLPLRESTIEDS